MIQIGVNQSGVIHSGVIQNGVILDTNVVISAIFFGGVPAQVLAAWRRGEYELVLSAEILDEYLRVGQAFVRRTGSVDAMPLLRLIAAHARVVDAPPLVDQVCSDPADDIFIACALASDCRVIVSGDRALLAVNGYAGIGVLTPKAFVRWQRGDEVGSDPGDGL